VLLWDHGGGSSFEHAEEGGADGAVVRTEYHTVRHNTHYGWMRASDQTVGMVLALMAACVSWGRNSYGLRLGVELGGTKRLNAFSTAAAATLMAPIGLLQFLFFHPNGGDPKGISSLHFGVSLSAFAFFANVLSFYVHKTTATTLDGKMHKGLGTVSAFISAGIFEGVWEKSEAVEVSTVLALILILIGQQQLLLGGPVKPQVNKRGTLLGYAPDGRPMYKVVESTFKPSSFAKAAGEIMKTILEHVQSRKIFFLLCLNSCYMLIEFSVGLKANSLGLISDAFHMLFNCFALGIGLYASVATRWKPNRIFSFGYGRVEVLCAYTNAVILATISVKIFVEGVKRMHHPPTIGTDWLLLTSFGGLGVNLVGIFGFNYSRSGTSTQGARVNVGGGGGGGGGLRSMSLEPGTPSADMTPMSRLSANMQTPTSAMRSVSQGSTDGNYASLSPTTSRRKMDLNNSVSVELGLPAVNPSTPKPKAELNMNSPFFTPSRNGAATGHHPIGQVMHLHVIADTLGSLGVIVSTFLVQFMDWHVADPICSLCIAVLILWTVLPLLSTTTMTLMNRSPRQLSSGRLAESLSQIKGLEGVIGCREVHVWSHAGQGVIGTLHVVAIPGANQQRILSQVQTYLKEGGVTSVTAQVETQGVRHGADRPLEVAGPEAFSDAYAEGGLTDIKAI
jgi:cation diffusion facilitator family transporter